MLPEILTFAVTAFALALTFAAFRSINRAMDAEDERLNERLKQIRSK